MMSNTGKRAVLLILDSVGVGALPDAPQEDIHANTLANTAHFVGGLHLPHLQELGLGNIIHVEGVPPIEEPQASWGKAPQQGVMTDTIAGHWELMGCPVSKPFPTYAEKIAPELLAKIEKIAGSKCLGGYPYSGTEIIKELGDIHIKTHAPIVYTSADSVIQIAAHENVMSQNELYSLCEAVRNQACIGEHAVARVIARPFGGSEGEYYRIDGRRDFSLEPISKTLLDVLREQDIDVHAIGKISDIFSGRGISWSEKTADNQQGMALLVEKLIDPQTKGFVFCNLNDFDTKWGHRNDATAYAAGLEAVDRWIPELITSLDEGDLLIITADHGCDPTDESTDHTREYVPLLALVKGETKIGENLGIRSTFADVGCTIGNYLGVKTCLTGTSFLGSLYNDK